ncbi:MAG: hypothetical protein PHR30_16560 [Gallionellaceae bacterium]|nr:hypothetical protein [Gallionellaceae bacterium]
MAETDEARARELVDKLDGLDGMSRDGYAREVVVLSLVAAAFADVRADERAKALQERESDESWMRRVYPEHCWTPADGISYADWCRRARARWEAEHKELKAELAKMGARG